MTWDDLLKEPEPSARALKRTCRPRRRHVVGLRKVRAAGQGLRHQKPEKGRDDSVSMVGMVTCRSRPVNRQNRREMPVWCRMVLAISSIDLWVVLMNGTPWWRNSDSASLTSRRQLSIEA